MQPADARADQHREAEDHEQKRNQMKYGAWIHGRRTGSGLEEGFHLGYRLGQREEHEAVARLQDKFARGR